MKKLLKKDFIKNLRNRFNEDIRVIDLIENHLLEKRGYIFKMPKPNSSVILLVSGGLDSIVSWCVLMEKFKLRVKPVFIKTGQRRNLSELKSLQTFSNLFKEKYFNLWQEPFIMTYKSSAPEISNILKNISKHIHPNVFKKNYYKNNNEVFIKRQYLFPALVPFIGSLPVLVFELCNNLRIRTIFTSILPSDGLYNASQSFTSIRTGMLGLTVFYNDLNWQYASINFEKEYGLWLDKEDLVKLGKKYKLPLEKTYSCFKGGKYNCGVCLACSVRKKSFQKAAIADKTFYKDVITIKDRVKEIMKKNALLFLLKNPLFKLNKKLNIKKKVIIKDYY